MSNLAENINNPVALRKAGIDILTKELGALGMALFLRQFENGYGDYTEERKELFDGITMADIEAALDQ